MAPNKSSTLDSKQVPHEHRVHRVGNWLPHDSRVHQAWLSGVIDKVDNNPKDLHPVMQEFKEMIESNTRVFLLFQSMFEQVPNKKPYNKDPSGKINQIRDYQHMLQLFNHMMTTAPHWSDQGERMGVVGLPINAILDWPMGTPSGWAAFLDPDVNRMIKKMLNAWGEFLMSTDSARQSLNDGSTGWLGETGKTHLETVANNAHGKGTNYKFHEHFECDPNAPFHGYKSWDDFFTRHFRPGIRPVASPEDDNVIVNACESKPYNLQRGCKLRDRFWTKGQPYSLLDMLAQDELALQFEGGTVYQAFLSALSYHRWHAPVSGTIVKAYVKDGTYYSEPLFEGIGDPSRADIDMGGEVTGQGYLTAVATRALIFIKADNPRIGTMCFVGVGMAEVSTCDITVKEGQHVTKGDEIGMFHFGGSTHCLVFGPDAKLNFTQPTSGLDVNIPVVSDIATVGSGN